MDNQPLTTTEAAELSDRTRRHMTYCAREGIIKAELFGHVWMIDRQDFDRWLATDRRTGPKTETEE